MNTQIVEKINILTKDKPILYLTNDPERALGVERLLSNYHILCIDQNESVDIMEKLGVKVFSLEKQSEKKNQVFRNSSKLYDSELIQNYIKKFSSPYLQVFKPSLQVEVRANRDKYILLNARAELNHRFEEKFSQLEFFKKIGVQIPKCEIYDVVSLDYDKLSEIYSKSFLIQFNRGHTGTGTKRITNISELEAIKVKFPKWRVKVSEFIEGKTYTVNGVTTREGVFLAGLNEQITGHKHLTDNLFSTVGNNFKTDTLLNSSLLNEIYEINRKIGEGMYSEGFRGFFGTDFIIQDNKIYIVEINARQTASVSFTNKLQIRNNETPLSLIHICEFLNIETGLNPKEYSLRNISSLNATQIVIRNTTSKNITIHESIKNGVYRLMSDNSSFNWGEDGPKKKAFTIYLDEERDKPLVFQKETYSVEDIDMSGILLTTVPSGRLVTPGSDIVRVQATHSLLSESGTLHPWVVELIKKVKDIYQIC